MAKKGFFHRPLIKTEYKNVHSNLEKGKFFMSEVGFEEDCDQGSIS